MALGDFHVGKKWREVGQIVDLGSVGDRGSHIQEAAHDDPLEWGRDDGTGQFKIGEGSCLLSIGGIPAHLFHGVIAEQALLVEGLAALQIAAQGVMGGAGPGHGNTLFLVIKFGQSLTGGDLVPLLHQEFLDHPSGSGGDGCLLLGPEAGTGGVKRRKRLPGHRFHPDGNGIGPGPLCVLFSCLGGAWGGGSRGGRCRRARRPAAGGQGGCQKGTTAQVEQIFPGHQTLSHGSGPARLPSDPPVPTYNTPHQFSPG
jgi:hypothetical protein